MFDYTDEEMPELAEEIEEQLKKEEIIELITELYFLLENKERLEVKRNIS